MWSLILVIYFFELLLFFVCSCSGRGTARNSMFFRWNPARKWALQARRSLYVLGRWSRAWRVYGLCCLSPTFYIYGALGIFFFHFLIWLLFLCRKLTVMCWWSINLILKGLLMKPLPSWTRLKCNFAIFALVPRLEASLVSSTRSLSLQCLNNYYYFFQFINISLKKKIIKIHWFLRCNFFFLLWDCIICATYTKLLRKENTL